MRKLVEEYPKEQLLFFLLKDDLIIEELRCKLELLTGCLDFGGCNSANEDCTNCYCNNNQQWIRCEAFKNAWKKYKKRKDNG